MTKGKHVLRPLRGHQDDNRERVRGNLASQANEMQISD
jgi:hypothetical protein